jgi:hypothetical protein
VVTFGDGISGRMHNYIVDSMKPNVAEPPRTGIAFCGDAT